MKFLKTQYKVAFSFMYCAFKEVGYFLLVIILISLSTFQLIGQTPFVTIWKTDNIGGSSNNQIQIPGEGNHYTIDWEEVADSSNNGNMTVINGSATVSFPSSGIYRISITPGTPTVSGSFHRIRFANSFDIYKIISIEQWGSIQWSSMEDAFHGCANLINNATDFPDLTQVTSMRRMFREAPNFNGDLGNCNTSSVTDMSEAFWGCLSFDQNIGNWNTENVTNMGGMFAGAISFNKDLSSWNTGNVTDMSFMFTSASSFNQEIGNWNTAEVTDMSYIFHNATSFNRNVGSWALSPTVSMADMFKDSGMDCDNYSQTLMGWAAQPNVPVNRILGNASPLKYGPAAQAARDLLEINKGWSIAGDVLDPACQVSSVVSAGLETFRVYPNPTSDKLFLDGTESGVYFLHDATGRMLESGRTEKGIVEMGRYPLGSYILSVTSHGREIRHHILKM